MNKTNVMEEEKTFLYHLTKLTGTTNAVTVDCMFMILRYIHTHAITEAHFLEAAYLDRLFKDEQYGIRICSVETLFHKYEEAIHNSDDVFLSLLRQKHRVARECLENEMMKQQIHKLLDIRKQTMEQHAIWTTITNILWLLQHFPHCTLGRFLLPLLPQLMQSVSPLSENDEDVKK
jgi:hypothetical protein